MKHAFTELANVAKLRGPFDITEGRAAVQRDLDGCRKLNSMAHTYFYNCKGKPAAV